MVGKGWLEPFHVTISRAKKQAYVTDAGAGTVVVLTFPRGNTIATLNAANGLGLPSSAVDSKNFIP
jgi:DNA-binding beta-propeller fold protein YncE